MKHEPEREPPEKLLLSAADAARCLSISPRKLWELTNCGAIPVVRIGRRTLYSTRELARWIEDSATRGPAT